MYEEVVKKLRRCVRSKCRGCEYEYVVSCRARLNEDAARAIEELNRALDWIPVTEQPPLKVGDDGYNGYLVYANGYYEIADYTIDKLDVVPYFHVDGEYETDVTHWMPLPEPPKEEI